jgi:opacity protein-like surface antigen
MKKIILTAAAVLAFGLTNAQDMKFGAKAGLNVASTDYSAPSGSNVSLSSVYGANAGVFADFKVSDKFSVQPELLFSMQGQKASLSETEAGYTASFENKLSLNYLNIPIMAKYYVIEKLSLQAGPQIGILMSATSKNDSTSNFPGDVNVSTSTDNKDKLNGVDFGLNFGAGFDITENISIDARYNLGLSQTQKDLGTNEKAIKNRVFSINLGYKF